VGGFRETLETGQKEPGTAANALDIPIGVRVLGTVEHPVLDVDTHARVAKQEARVAFFAVAEMVDRKAMETLVGLAGPVLEVVKFGRVALNADAALAFEASGCGGGLAGSGEQ